MKWLANLLTVAPYGGRVNQDGGKPSCTLGVCSGRKLPGCGSARDVCGALRE